MRQKMVWRYWCDWCRKGGCQKSAMVQHEKSCTLNPQRECRVCPHAKGMGRRYPEHDLEYLKMLARNDSAELAVHDEDLKALPTGEVVAAMLDAAGQCPVCVFAALRQTGRHKPTTDPETGGVENTGYTFDLKKEMVEFWKTANEYDERSSYSCY